MSATYGTLRRTMGRAALIDFLNAYPPTIGAGLSALDPGYGVAADGVTSAVAGLQAIVDALDAGDQLIVPPGSYLMDGTLTIAKRLAIVALPGAEFVTNGSGANAVAVQAAGVTIDGLTFRSTALASATADTFLYVADANGFLLRDCVIGRGLMRVRSTGTTPITGLRIRDCDFTGDYTGSSGADINNVLDVRGVTDVSVTGCRVAVQNCYYLFKCSSALGDTSPFDTGRSRRVLFAHNQVRVTASVGAVAGTNVEGVLDLYASTEDVQVTDNQFEIAGPVPSVVNHKAGTSGQRGPYVNNVVVGRNTVRVSDATTTPILIEGCWGLSGATVKNKCAVVDNEIEQTAGSTLAAITVKGMNVARIAGNQREAGALAFSRFISASNNQLLAVTQNQATYGMIELSGNGSTQGGESYGNQPESIVVTDNQIDDFEASGAIVLTTISACEDVTIADNHCRNQTDTGNVGGPISFISTTITRLMLHDNVANLANVLKNVPSGTPTVTTLRQHDNSWDVGLRLPDNVTPPATLAGYASLYTDVADGDFKIKYGDGVVKLIVIDT